MSKRFNDLFWLGFVVFIVWIFCSWFGFGEISGGDAAFYYRETLKNLPGFPYLWLSPELGGYSSQLYNFPYLVLILKLLSCLCLSWNLIERFIWYWPFLGISIFSSWYLLKTVVPGLKFKFLAPFIYLFNSYILMIIGGGQISIALAYAITPLVLALLIKRSVIGALILAIQLSFEPRFVYISIIIYISYILLVEYKNWLIYLEHLFFTLLVVVGLHFYWILPTLVVRRLSFDPFLQSNDWLKFLNFADFSKSFSLLHPNWPENIFGKTYFFRPGFLILPILAFSSLLFINKINSLRVKKNVIFFAFLGLLGAFLAKGVNQPFGFVYRWFFENVPGFNLFRDSTKFYLLIALSYSVLIPFTVSEIYNRLEKIRKNYAYLFLLFIICCLLLLIKPAWIGQLGGTLKTRPVPQEYSQLKDFLNNQNNFFRTFWVPKRQRFGFSSANHPGIDAESYVTDFLCREPLCSLKQEIPNNWGKECPKNDRCYVRELGYFLNPNTRELFNKLAIKYVIIPLDSEAELFIDNYKYNGQQREEVERFLDTIAWLKKVVVADKIAVYETPLHQDHFYFEKPNIGEISNWQMFNPTMYKLKLRIEKTPALLIFSETYDNLWQAKINNQTIKSIPYNGLLNSFEINQTGDLQVEINYLPQKYVYYGGVVSILTLMGTIGYLWYFRLKLKK